MRALLFLSVFLATSPVLAQPTTGADGEVAAKAAADRQRLWDLAETNRQAATTDSDPKTASAHRDEAIKFYKQFLETKPPEATELVARGWLAKLQEQHDAEFPAEAARRRDQATREREEKIRAEEQRLAADRRTKAEEQRHLRGAVTTARTKSELGKARIVSYSGLGAIGAGVIATGVGVYFGVKARSISNELGASDTYDTDKISDGKQKERYMMISYATGGALMLGGALTYWIGRGIADRAERAPVAVVPADGGAQLMVSGSF